MTRRKRTQTEGSDASDHFVSVNERPVDDIRYSIRDVLIRVCGANISWLESIFFYPVRTVVE